MTKLEQNNTNPNINKLEFMTLTNPTICRLPVSRECLSVNGIHISIRDLASVRTKRDGSIVIVKKGLELTLHYTYEFPKTMAIALMKETWYSKSEVMRFD